MLVLFVVTFIDAAVHQCYFFWTGTFLRTAVGIPGNWVMPVMSIGQIAEIVTMAVPGLRAQAPRLADDDDPRHPRPRGCASRSSPSAPSRAPAILVNVLHGICYAFFFATVYIFVDEFFPKDVRSSAQGLFNFLILGLGRSSPTSSAAG